MNVMLFVRIGSNSLQIISIPHCFVFTHRGQNALRALCRAVTPARRGKRFCYCEQVMLVNLMPIAVIFIVSALSAV